MQRLIDRLKSFGRFLKGGPFGKSVIYDDHSHALRGE